MPGRIWLIAEDESDLEVVQSILARKKFAIKVLLRKPDAAQGGISRFAKELDKLVRNIRERKEPNDCIAVLHDTDEHHETNRERYDHIKQICAKYRADVVLVTARSQIEAWLLADNGLCAWLETSPRNWDEQSDPKSEFHRLLSKKGIGSKARARSEALKHLDGSGDQRSPSLRAALKHLENAPCTKP